METLLNFLKFFTLSIILLQYDWEGRGEMYENIFWQLKGLMDQF
jgi:hypothetical protein